jgi:cytosine/adenosine deaminase-related metal-dependent hydrolase
MRRISANYIFPIDSPPIRNGIIETDDSGTIRKIYDFGGEMVELAHTEFISGILVPGFINMHTHLELSNFKRIEPKKKDLPYFIRNIVQNRTENEALAEAFKADRFMHRKGIVAVCDISNTNLTIPVKKQSNIRYHTFAEITGLKSNIAENKLTQIKKLKSEYEREKLAVSIAPHAPYSISTALWKLLAKEFEQQEYLSMHNQETELENQMFLSGDGELIELFRELELSEQWNPTEKSSLQSVAPFLNSKKILLVHNTFISNDDLKHLKTIDSKFGFVLCPTSNMQITGKLPNVDKMISSGVPIMLGTDSPASGQSLDLLDEMKCLQNELNISFETMLQWATKDAADYMNWNELGRFAIGIKPGINLITGFDFKAKKLKESAKIKRIL